jgi:hypothetical protein
MLAMTATSSIGRAGCRGGSDRRTLPLHLRRREKDADARMAKTGEEPTPMTAPSPNFESPKDSEKQP